jgi:fibronectin type 3 domain-containing protein
VIASPAGKALLGAIVIVSSAACFAAESRGRPDHPLNTWVKHSPREGAAAPRLQYEGSGALDPAGRQWIHFAGHDGIPQGFYLFTCRLDDGRWQQHFPNTSPPGVCCVDGSNAFDAANRRFVAVPGGSLGHGYQWSRGVKLKQSNVWLYDPAANEWTNMRPPPYKQPEKYSRDIIGSLNSAATYDPNHEVVITLGGQGAGGPTNALFVYDAYANRLEHLKPADPPSPRDGMGLCYDARNDCLVTFGSQYLNDEKTWMYRFSTNRWEGHDLDPHPPGKKEGTYSTNPKMAYDEASGVCLCVVRRDKESGLPTGTLETWALDVAGLQWTKLEPAASPDPSASRARNLGYSADDNLFLLESVAADKSGPQLWTYRYANAPGERRPAPPTDLRVATQPGKAALRWEASKSAGVSSYNVYRAAAERAWETEYAKIATTGGTLFTDEGLSEGRVYFYRVAAVGGNGLEGNKSAGARTQPRVVLRPVVSVLAADEIEVRWSAHPAGDVAGYNLYRGVVTVGAVQKGSPGAWKDNDPEYPEPVVVSVQDIGGIELLNASPLVETRYVDTKVDLRKKGAPSGEYRYAVYAYIVTAVNRLGTESGPSPYALTLPAEPRHVLLREKEGAAELKWEPSEEKSVEGYRIYKLGASHWEIVRLTDEPIRQTSFRHAAGGSQTRYWVVPVDRLGQEGQPSSPVWCNHSYKGFFEGEWHQ